MQYKPRLKEFKKKCEFKGCKEKYTGNIINKYCPEHRKQKYRKFIDKDKIREKKEIKELSNPNQLIKHTYKQPTVIQGTCQLKGCGANFDLLIIPKTYIYPRFCQEHRCEYKRYRFLEQYE
jgi:hypothetical protein